MSITKRSFLIICLIISGILITLNLVTYGLFQHSITNQILASYDSLVDANNSLCRLFTQELDQLTYMYTSDEELGICFPDRLAMTGWRIFRRNPS